jgi:hypothetical protein
MIGGAKLVAIDPNKKFIEVLMRNGNKVKLGAGYTSSKDLIEKYDLPF